MISVFINQVDLIGRKIIGTKIIFIFTLSLFLTLCVVPYSFATDAVLVWVSEPESGVTQINVQRMKNNEWQTIEVVYRSRERNFSPSVGSNQNGDITVVWSATSTIRSIVRSISFQNDGWQSAQIVSNQGGEATTPAIIFDSNDIAFITWVSDHNGLDDVFYRQFDQENNAWTDIEQVNEQNEVPDIRPNLSLTQAGEIIVGWRSISKESGVYVDLDKIYTVVNSENDSDSKINADSDLNYSDIEMPKGWPGALGRAVIHFPANSSMRSEKLPPTYSNGLSF